MARSGKGWDVQKRVGKTKTTYLARVRVHGHEPRSHTFDDQLEAENWAKGVAAKLVVGDPTLTGGNEPFGAWLKRYHDEEAHKWSTETDKKRRLVELQGQPIAKIPVRLVTPADFERLRDWLLTTREPKLSPPTVRHYLIECSAVWRAASFKWRVTQLANPLKAVAIPPPSKGKRTRVRTPDRQQILDELGKLQNPFYAPYAEFLYETSLRAAEPLTLCFSDVDATDQVAELKVKGGKTRLVPLSERALELIEAARAIRESGRCLAWGHYNIEAYDAELVWPITYRGFKNGWDTVRTKLGVGAVNPHDLRRERSTSLLEDGRSMDEVMIVTGHTNDKIVRQHYNAMEASRVAKSLPRVNRPPASGAARASGSVLARVKAAVSRRRV